MKLVIKQEHCVSLSQYYDPLDCPIARAFRESYNNITLLGVNTDFIRTNKGKYSFDYELFNHIHHSRLLKNTIQEVEIELTLLK